MITHINSNKLIEFSELKQNIDSEIPAILDFSAKWCGPCKKLYPYLVKLASTYTSVNFYKIDISDSDDTDLSETYKISSLPTILYIHKGSVIFREEGCSNNASNVLESFAKFYCQVVNEYQKNSVNVVNKIESQDSNDDPVVKGDDIKTQTLLVSDVQDEIKNLFT